MGDRVMVSGRSPAPTLRWALMVSGDQGAAEADSHWVRWHAPYDDPTSALSERLRLVQSMLCAALDEIAPGRDPGDPIRIVSICAGQGRDVIDVLAERRGGPEVSALLVELDPGLVAFARQRVAEAGLSDQVRVVEGDASLSHWYADDVPADVVLVCGVFGNISAEDIAGTIEVLPGFCRPGAHVIWTRHRRPPDLTPALRGWFEAAGFTEMGFGAPDGFVLGTGRHRFDGDGSGVVPFDTDRQLFDFVGDGHLPA
jgi:hypothetical protein